MKELLEEGEVMMEWKLVEEELLVDKEPMAEVKL